MSISDTPSIATIGADWAPGGTVFEFLCETFPKIPPSAWRKRIESGKVLHEGGNPVELQDSAVAGTRIMYFREVENEPVIPFKEKILYADDHILVVDKPHFLPVVPAGKYVNETLLNRVKKITGINDIVTLNRLDRQTAGIVLLSLNRKTRDAYYSLFRNRLVHKYYKAISRDNGDIIAGMKWRIENRVVRGDPWFRMKCVGENAGVINAVTDIVMDKRDRGLCFFSLHPVTGQKHQLRVHLSLLGYPVLNDRLYPDLMPEQADDYSRPLKLLAERVGFRDPLTGRLQEFQSEHVLERA